MGPSGSAPLIGHGSGAAGRPNSATCNVRRATRSLQPTPARHARPFAAYPLPHYLRRLSHTRVRTCCCKACARATARHGCAIVCFFVCLFVLSLKRARLIGAWVANARFSRCAEPSGQRVAYLRPCPQTILIAAGPMAAVGPVPVQMWAGWAPSRFRYGCARSMPLRAAMPSQRAGEQRSCAHRHVCMRRLPRLHASHLTECVRPHAPDPHSGTAQPMRHGIP